MHLVDVGLFFCKAQLRETLVLDTLQQVILKQFLDFAVLERLACVVLVVQSMDGVRKEDFWSKMWCRVGENCWIRRRRDMAPLHPL